ncbi:DEAD/DEAH box helicase [Demequina lutea]|uniref:ATP-dependent RNA helicase HelY n=1 Tax=Demequina lutea TaxID=431489 RepID=A0A7Z0CK00_9MICO|nr:DEAD/DEAH box helicase [Demequina lutea]NYI41398.1 ATP-dependent RNA helicase HelY [Demequina lutea]
MTSPAERYAAARERSRSSDLVDFEATLSFALDDFQRDGCQAVADGHSVLVAAPTGAGKTVVGEFAVAHAQRRGRKAFYTTPIKALSNQKYGDLRAIYGPEKVGLLTGDTSINPHADIVVMTTEVLRNMIYAGSSSLDRLGVVVLDEVHYLADRFRGSVWEEVIVHVGAATSIVSLSATVSNAEEFGAWLTEVRGDTKVIVSERRPVPLWPHVMLREGLFDLYAPGTDPSDLGPNPRINPELEAVAKRSRHDEQGNRPARSGYRGGRGSQPKPRRSPPRFAVIDQLDAQALLPAIVFVFSRAGCEDAVEQVKASGIRLTSDEERRRIAEIIEVRCSALPPEDLGPLGFTAWRDNLEAGLAAHHAGLIPLFKEVVEELFAAGLIKVVYATETLALGINMPARSVVLEKLVKWDGESHKDLTAGEYTQLTGRAGRRGIDVEGHAVVIEHPGFDAGQLARLASRRTYPLVSSFQPSYNMAINLVGRSGVQRARDALEMSFAQFQADASVVGKARRVRELDGALEGFREAMRCDRGDFREYAGLREKLSRNEKDASQTARRATREATVSQLSQLRRGDLVRILGGRRSGVAVVIASDDDPKAPRPTVVTDAGRATRLSVADLTMGLDTVGRLTIPGKFNAQDARARKELGVRALGEARVARDKERTQRRPRQSQGDADAVRAAMRNHPCHSCPEREDHARWAERYFRTLRDKDRIATEIQRATGSIAAVFDRRCAVLRECGYLSGEGEETVVTAAGTTLKTLYAENDIVMAECLREDVWGRLNPAGLAAAVSTLLYSARRDDGDSTPRIPGGPQGILTEALKQTQRVWSRFAELHEVRDLPPLPAPHWGLVNAIHGWAQGKSLDAVISKTDVAPGDMVRWCKQVIDALDQIAQSAPESSTSDRARAAIAAMRRGVVAY